MQLWFYFNFYNAVSSCESRDFLDPGGLARPPGAQKLQDSLPLLSKVLADLLVTIGVFTSRHIVQAGPRQGQKLVGGLLPTSEA